MMQLGPDIKLIISDVDETVADVYMDIDPALSSQLESLLGRGVKIIFSSGSGFLRIENGVIFKLRPDLRKNILVSHCSSSEIWGYDGSGNRIPKPFYSSVEGVLTDVQKKVWRDIMQEMIVGFGLRTYLPMPIDQFRKVSSHDPLSIIYDDRGVQITLEVVNGYDLDASAAKKLNVKLQDGKYDMRNELIAWAKDKFESAHIPIQIHKGGVFAINFLITSSDKGGCIRIIKDDRMLLDYLGIQKNIFEDSSAVEVWGDKFSQNSGKNDWCISTALDSKVRSISFRKSDEVEYFPKGFNIQKWDGKKDLFAGVLEYLKQGEKRQ